MSSIKKREISLKFFDWIKSYGLKKMITEKNSKFGKIMVSSNCSHISGILRATWGKIELA